MAIEAKTVNIIKITNVQCFHETSTDGGYEWDLCKYITYETV